jgi:hypothetical protein
LEKYSRIANGCPKTVKLNQKTMFPNQELSRYMRVRIINGICVLVNKQTVQQQKQQQQKKILLLLEASHTNHLLVPSCL